MASSRAAVIYVQTLARRWIRAAHGLALEAGPRRLARRKELAAALRPALAQLAPAEAAVLWSEAAEEGLLMDYPPPRLGPAGLGDAGGPPGPLAGC